MALVSFVVFFVMFTVIGLLFPSHINSANAVIVNNHRHIVLNEIRPSAHWKNWYPFFRPGVSAQVEQAGKDSILFVSDGNRLLIHAIKPDSNGISFLMKNDNGRTTQHQLLALDIPNDSNQVQLVWKETEKLKWFPWERFRGLVLEKAKKEYLEAVLNGFRNYADTIRTY